MSDVAKVLAVIPARAGSKGLPGKNFLSLAGKPLIQWTIEAAVETRGIDHVVVSSDDELVLELAKSLGVTAYRRPAELCGDLSQASEVIADVVSAFPDYQTLVYLQPTSPLRRESHISEALERFNTGLNVPVISVAEVTQPPEWMFTLNEQGLLKSYLPADEMRRQDTHLKFIPNGAIYIAHIDSLKKDGFVFSKSNSLPFVMDSKTSIDIDDKFDFELAEWIIQKL
jgi:CMP-N,N'-diacetyllegionaminic acid synthase